MKCCLSFLLFVLFASVALPFYQAESAWDIELESYSRSEGKGEGEGEKWRGKALWRAWKDANETTNCVNH